MMMDHQYPQREQDILQLFVQVVFEIQDIFPDVNLTYIVFLSNFLVLCIPYSL